jgi:serine/threonine protein kinase
MAALGDPGAKGDAVREERVRGVCVVGAKHRESVKVCIELFDQCKILGYGGFAVVRKAIRKDTGDVYALKITSKKKALEVSRGEPAHHSLYCELRALAHCKGSFIANMHWAFQDEVHNHAKDYLTPIRTNHCNHHNFFDNCKHHHQYRLYLVLDYGHFGDLRSIMALTPTGRLSEEAARFYVCQVMLALDMCHFNGVLHRDTKPENVVVDMQVAKHPTSQNKSIFKDGQTTPTPPHLLINSPHPMLTPLTSGVCQTN